MNNLVESTKRVFGDRAPALLDAGAIMPVTKNKTPAVRSWRNPTDPAAFKDRKDFGYAIKTGAVSGLTGVDFDGLIIPPSYNTHTRRGFHSWVPYEPGDSNRTNVNASKVDIRGEGGFLVFSSPEHSVVKTGLLNRDDFLEWLSPISPILDTYTYECIGVWNMSGKHPYIEKIERHGYEVRIDWVANRLASGIRNSEAGGRNQSLYVSVAQVVNLGGTRTHVQLLWDAAIHSGLGESEVRKTVDSACKASKVIPVFDIVRGWGEQAIVELKRRRVRNTDIVEHLVRLSTEQHSLRPLVSIQAASQELGIKRETIGNQLNMLIEAKSLAKKVNSGRQSNGNLHPNNYIILGGK